MKYLAEDVQFVLSKNCLMLAGYVLDVQPALEEATPPACFVSKVKSGVVFVLGPNQQATGPQRLANDTVFAHEESPRVGLGTRYPQDTTPLGERDFRVPEVDYPNALQRSSNTQRNGARAQQTWYVLLKPLAIDGRDLQVTTSIGIAIYPRDGSNIEDLLKVADAAMYYTKEHGRNSYKLSGDKARACTTTPPAKTLIIKNLK